MRKDQNAIGRVQMGFVFNPHLMKYSVPINIDLVDIWNSSVLSRNCHIKKIINVKQNNITT